MKYLYAVIREGSPERTVARYEKPWDAVAAAMALNDISPVYVVEREATGYRWTVDMLPRVAEYYS